MLPSEMPMPPQPVRPAPEPQPKPRVKFKIEPEPGGQLEQLLIVNKQAYDRKGEADDIEEETKAAVKGFLLGLFPDGKGLPDTFEIPADAHGRYPAYTLSIKKGKRFDTKKFRTVAGDDLYEQFEVEITPSWELRESTPGRRR